MNAVAKEDRLEVLAEHMLKMPQGKGNLRHLFYPGIYIRELSVSAGSYCVGRVHKNAQLNIMTKGAVMIRQEDGSFEELKAPQIFMGKPGRKVGVVTEDMVWLNVYATECRDVEEIEAANLEESPALKGAQLLLEGPQDTGYEKMLEELGVTDEQVQRESAIEIDRIPFPYGEYKVKIGVSRIAGRGLIATADISEGEFICPARIGDKRTPAGYSTNHSDFPNADSIKVGDNIYLIALRDISGCRGGLDGEEVTIDYRIPYRMRISQ